MKMPRFSNLAVFKMFWSIVHMIWLGVFFASMMRSDKWDDMADGQMCWKMFLQCMKIANHLASSSIPNQSLQFRFSKKATKIWENLSMDLNQLEDFVRFSKKATKVMAKSFAYCNLHQLDNFVKFLWRS